AADWSQEDLWETYYGVCTRVPPPAEAYPEKPYCMEPVVAYLLNWRGENFYTHGEIIPLKKDNDLDYFLRENGDRTFYAILQPNLLDRFTRRLPRSRRDSVEQVHNENMQFVLLRIPAVVDDTP
ncbi:MAG: hypothetical protein KC561_16940, partial [Myxococcales bacterium]|nr:hypothetical protein [Myxococcales bacterium]